MNLLLIKKGMKPIVTSILRFFFLKIPKFLHANECPRNFTYGYEMFWILNIVSLFAEMYTYGVNCLVDSKYFPLLHLNKTETSMSETVTLHVTVLCVGVSVGKAT